MGESQATAVSRSCAFKLSHQLSLTLYSLPSPQAQLHVLTCPLGRVGDLLSPHWHVPSLLQGQFEQAACCCQAEIICKREASYPASPAQDIGAVGAQVGTGGQQPSAHQ